jgi:hypothetical protein
VLARALLAALGGTGKPADVVLDTELIVRGSTVASASLYADTTT